VPSDGVNVGAVVTDEGVLLINPPAEPELTEMRTALRRVTDKAVRWVLGTCYSYVRSGRLAQWADQGIVVLGSIGLWKTVSSTSDQLVATVQGSPSQVYRPRYELGAEDVLPVMRIEFDRQIHLFPGGIEVRILGLQHSAHSAGDMVVYLPGEKVLLVGDLFAPGRYPEIDVDPGGGDALGAIDGLKEIVDDVPLLKEAIPQPKDEPEKEDKEEKTLAELVAVIPGHGPPSDLQEVKNVLEQAQKLRAAIARMIAAGASRERLLSAPSLSPFENYDNFDPYATQLFDCLVKR
jgi:cyclase